MIPGIIDIHTNGAFGVDFAVLQPGDFAKVSRRLAAHGCTAFLPTLISNKPEYLNNHLRCLERAVRAETPGAQPLGIHLEGPFLNPAQAGAHPRDRLIAPSIRLFDQFQVAAGGRIRLLTLAPELPGADRLIAHCREDCVVSAGHSLAGFEEMSRAIDWGVRCSTHTFNAMRKLDHRDPGLVEAVLTRPEVFAAFIPDGLHLHPSLVELLVRCKGNRRSVMVTDSISAAGMPDGDYPLGGLTISLSEGVCRNSQGVLAGSCLLPDQGLRNLWEWLGQGLARRPLDELVTMVSTAPAELLGLDRKGRIEAGCDADLVLLDDRLRVLKTWVKGELVYQAQSRDDSP